MKIRRESLRYVGPTIFLHVSPEELAYLYEGLGEYLGTLRNMDTPEMARDFPGAIVLHREAVAKAAEMRKLIQPFLPN